MAMIMSRICSSGEIVADFAGVLCGGEEWLASGDHPGAVVAEYGVAGVRVLEQLGGDVVLADDEGEEPLQPGRQHRAGRLSLERLGSVADRVDLVGVEGLK